VLLTALDVDRGVRMKRARQRCERLVDHRRRGRSSGCRGPGDCERGDRDHEKKSGA